MQRTHYCPQPQCKQKNNQVRWICQHPICFNFKELCDECYTKHKQFHESYKNEQEPEIKDPFISYENQKSNIQKLLLKVREDLEKLQEAAFNEIEAMANPDLPIENTIKELEEIKNQINKEFDSYIEKLREKFERPIKEKIKDIFEEIKQKLQKALEFFNSCDQIETLKTVSQNDLPYQVAFQKARLESLILERRTKKYEGVIDDDVVLRFIGAFQQELKNLIYFPQQEQLNQQHLMLQGRNQKHLNGNQQMKNWLFWFQPGTKLFHFIDVSKPSPQFMSIELQIDFLIYPNHRSIFATNQNIYLLGGYDPKNINAENEDNYKYVYQLDLDNKTLKKVSNLITLRHSFGVCCFQNYIYVVGGYNYMEGSLSKCEKISLEKAGQHNSIPVNNLQQKASHVSVSAFQDKHIFKFGGILLDSHKQSEQFIQQRQLVEFFFEIYDPGSDQWIVNEGFDNFTPYVTFLNCTVETSDQIYIFGGFDVNQNLTKYIFTLQPITSNGLDIEMNQLSELQNSCFTTFQALYYKGENQNKIYYLANEKKEAYQNPKFEQPVLRYFNI